MNMAPPPPEPEWSVPIVAAEAVQLAQPINIAADTDACAALAQRFDLVSLDQLSARLTIVQKGQNFHVDGTWTAAYAQSCVATGEPIALTPSEPFTIIFARDTDSAASASATKDTECALDADDLDIVPFSGGIIDLGEAVAQTLALSINPYPRSAGAEEWLRTHGVLKEEEAGAFGALSELLGTLRK